jgi:predicted nucleic acid-binding protein
LIVVDTNILSYLARAGCLSEFLAAFAGQIAATPLVRAEVERALAAGHSQLAAALDAFGDGRIALIDLAPTEQAEMVALRAGRRGLSMTDCSLFVAARTYDARLLTHERKLQRVAQEGSISIMTLAEALDQAVMSGLLTPEQRDHVLQVARL